MKQPFDNMDIPSLIESPPTRGRGLKRVSWEEALEIGIVAPHTGAWIETATGNGRRRTRRVAPHTGAWIETKNLPDKERGR